MTTIAIIDDHTMVRRGIQSLLEMEDDFRVVGELGTGVDAGPFAARFQPDVILLDIRMPGQDGIAALREILAARPAQKVIMLTTSEADNDIYESMKLGAKGYLMKDRDSDELVNAVRAVAAGDTFIPEAVKALYSEREQTKNLSARELSILDFTAKGCANKEIGEVLGISAETVKAALKSIYQKLGVEDRVSAVMEAYRRGFLHQEK